MREDFDVPAAFTYGLATGLLVTLPSLAFPVVGGVAGLFLYGFVTSRITGNEELFHISIVLALFSLSLMAFMFLDRALLDTAVLPSIYFVAALFLFAEPPSNVERSFVVYLLGGFMLALAAGVGSIYLLDGRHPWNQEWNVFYGATVFTNGFVFFNVVYFVGAVRSRASSQK